MTGNVQQGNTNPRPMPMRPSAQPQAGMTPKEIVGIIRRHLFMIFLFTILGSIAGVGGWFAMNKYNPKYTAIAAIAVDPPGENDIWTFDRTLPNKEIYYQFRFTQASYMKQQSFLQELLKIDNIRDTTWYSRFDNDIAEMVEDLEDNLRVSPQRDGNWIIVSMTCRSDEESAKIVNEAVKYFVQKQSTDARKDTATQLEQLKTQQNKIKNLYTSLEGQLENLRQGTDYANLEPTTFRSYLDETLSDAQSSRNAIEGQTAELRTIIALLKQRLAGEYDETVREQIERDTTAITIRNRITLLEQERASQLSRFGQRHRQVIELNDAIDQLYKDLDHRKLVIGNIVRSSRLINAEDELIARTEVLKTLELQRQKAQVEYRDISILKAEYARKVSLRDEQKTTLEEINMHIEKVQAVHDDPKLSKVKQVVVANKPLQKSSPKIIVYGPGGFMLGIMLGLGLAFLVELLNDLVRNPSDVAKYLRIPLLGAICHKSEDNQVKRVDLYHVVRQAPYSMMSENYRQLRTNIRLSDCGSTKKVIYVTSPSVGGGKTTVALNLASTLVAEGQRVLLIDTHFRKPTAGNSFPNTTDDGVVIESGSNGLSNYLLGHCEYQEVVRGSGIDGLNIIDCGPMPSNSAEILGNARMSNLLENTSHEYDYVLIDGPGLLVTSAKVLASQAEGTLLVLNTSSTRRGEALRTLRELKAVNAQVIGVVLVGVKAMKGGYFHERYRTYRKYQKMQVPATI